VSGNVFSERYRNAPNDLVLKRYDHRIYLSPISKILKHSASLQNTYFHLSQKQYANLHNISISLNESSTISMNQYFPDKNVSYDVTYHIHTSDWEIKQKI
jgi:hypothetical protein